MVTDNEYLCEFCNKTHNKNEVIRSKTYGDLDSEKWQTFCCPNCGRRIKTVFVGLEEVKGDIMGQ